MSIQRSNELDQLFAALSKFQGKVEKAKKDQKGYQNNYSFAKLSQYIDLSQDLLAEHGLSVLQFPESLEIVEVTKEIIEKETKKITYQLVKVPKQKITTWIGHESGQFVSGSMEILVEKLSGMSWGQSTGSAISYARRYARAGSLGMDQEDNDNQNNNHRGNTDNQRKNESPPIKNESPPIKNESPPIKNESPPIKNESPPIRKINPEEAHKIRESLMGDTERLNKTLRWANIKRLEDLSINQYNTIMSRIMQNKTSVIGSVQNSSQDNSMSEESKNISEEKISAYQVDYIKRLITQDRLEEMLSANKLERLEDMDIGTYRREYDGLRMETINTVKPENNQEKVA